MRAKHAVIVLTFALSAATLTAPGRARADAPGAASLGDLYELLGVRGPAPSTRSTLPGGPPPTGVAGQPPRLARNAAFSSAVMSAFGGRNTQFSEIALLADWDGREDMTADRAAKVDDFSGTELEIDQLFTRVALSEHTIANGFNESVFYYADSVGNVWVGIDTGGLDTDVEIVRQINLPTVLNAFGTINSDDQVIVSGLAVSPVADLTSFPNVNGAFAPFSGQIGEILYVTFEDGGGGVRLSVNNEVVHSGLLAFPIADIVSPATAAPGVLSTAGDPITIGGGFGVAFSTFHNIAGVAVDDDGSIYFQQVDLDQFTGANIVKVTDTGTDQDRSAATNGFLTITTLNPASGVYGSASGPATQVNRFTNYSGTSTTFGNIVAIAAGPGNTLYAAVARSLVSTDDAATQATEGLFLNPAALGPTPSMVVSFSDTSGAFDLSSSPGGGFAGNVPIGNDIADVATAGATLAPGVNNFRVFVLGDGPDIRSVGSPIRATPTNTLKLAFQADYTIYGGIAVDEEGKVYVVSGGTPSGVGRNPSAALGEILLFSDDCPADRRADYVDFRGDSLPNPPASGGNVGDGDSDRFDHIFSVAPIDGTTASPTGIAGLARGFLRYTNRLAPNAISAGVTLGQTGGSPVLGDDDSTGVIVFDDLDPGHQVAGGDDQGTPFRGDDDDGAGNPVLAGATQGGFEFVLGGPVGVPNCVWNGFFWNSNGNVTFGVGDNDNTPTEEDLRTGAPRVAGAWSDLNPGSRVGGGFLNTFPVLALGFSNINHFAIRWINVPEFGKETTGSRNTLTIDLYDDGVGADENASQPLNPANPIGNNAVPFDLQEGPTDLRFVRDPGTGAVLATHVRDDGSGANGVVFARMDLIGASSRPVLVGYSVGGLSASNPPGLCEINLGEASRAADSDPFHPCAVGTGLEPTIHEFFDAGVDGSIGGGGEVNLPTVDFDLRSEGNDVLLSTPSRQIDLNRGRVLFLGAGCAPPPNPLCFVVQSVPPTVVGPDQPAVIGTSTVGVVNVLCGSILEMLGDGFTPDQATTVCGGTGASRPGRTVTTVLELLVDTNGDSVPDTTTALTDVEVVSDNLVRGRLAPAPGLPGSPFALGFCGGSAELRLTTTFTAGDDNVFGSFSRTTSCAFDTGVRAPVVLSTAPSTGSAAISQALTITGDCFLLGAAATPNVTSVFAVQVDHSAHIIPATTFSITDATHLQATFDFEPADAGKTFALHAQSANGLSRNLRKARPGQDPGCPLGNEQGDLVTFVVTP